MHDKVIDEILGLAGKFHDLVGQTTLTPTEVDRIVFLGAQVMLSLREILQPSPEQSATIHDRLNALVIEKIDEAASSQGAVH